MSDGVRTAATGIKGETRIVEPDRSERSIARRSAESRATVPSVEFGLEVDAGALLERAAECGAATAAPPQSRDRGSRLTARVLSAVARALRTVPRVNGAYRDGRFELYTRVNVGLTIAGDGLYVIATVFDADEKALDELEVEVAELRTRALAGELSPAELTGATFTLTDDTDGGVATLTPLVVPPQAAALCAGPIRAQPVVRGASVVPGHTMWLTLACDHRIVYGTHATAFLEAVGSNLEEGLC